MSTMSTLTRLLLVGGVAAGLAACNNGGDDDTEVDCTNPDDPGFCDCEENADAEECVEEVDPCEDPEDPEYCDCPENREAEACGGPIFEPWLISPTADFAYDPGTNSLTDYVVEGNPIESAINMIIYDERFSTTQNLAYVCAVNIVPNDPASVTLAASQAEFSWINNGSSGTYDLYGFTLSAGSFTAVDAPFQTQQGTIEGCLSKRYDPAVYGDDIQAVFESVEWGAHIAATGPREVDDALEDPSIDDAANDWDLYSLNQNGYVLRGAMGAGGDPGVFFYSYAFALDSSSWTLIDDTANEGNDFVRLQGSDMFPSGEDLPAAGLYLLRPEGLAFTAGALSGG